MQRLREEARARAEAVAGHPIEDGQELSDFRRGMLKEVASDFDAKGVGIRTPGVVNREEIHDRSRARLEARLAASEDRGQELEVELSTLKARIEDGDRPAPQGGR